VTPVLELTLAILAGSLAVAIAFHLFIGWLRRRRNISRRLGDWGR
jgi:hypothetical protein